MTIDIKQQIETSLKAFTENGGRNPNLREASLDLLKTLGYQSEKTLNLDGSPNRFLREFDNAKRAFRKDKASFSDWQEIQLLFQLTDRELGTQNTLSKEHLVQRTPCPKNTA